MLPSWTRPLLRGTDGGSYRCRYLPGGSAAVVVAIMVAIGSRGAAVVVVVVVGQRRGRGRGARLRGGE